MLIIIVSVGFGVVKPRLGDTLHKIVAVGGLYFTLSCIEANVRVMRVRGVVECLRTKHTRADVPRQRAAEAIGNVAVDHHRCSNFLLDHDSACEHYARAAS